AREDLPKFDIIQLRRPSTGFSQAVFTRGTNDWNHFTLFELLVVHYQPLAASPGGYTPRTGFRPAEQFNRGLSFPDLEHVRLRRPAASSKQWREEVFDLNQMLVAGACKDVPLEWGDVVELPEADHPLNQQW